MLWENFFLPPDLPTALKLKAQYGASSHFIAGGTDLVVDLEHGRLASAGMTLIDISRLSELHAIALEENGLRIGGAVTHAELLANELIQEYAPVLNQAAIEVGAPQIRNRSTLAGNLVTASPAADTVPPLLALDAVVELESVRGLRFVPIAQFLTGFRKTDLAPDEIVKSLFIPAPQNQRRGVFLKLGLRKAQAISVISVCVVIEIDSDNLVTKANVTLGSVAPTTLLVPGVGELLVGKRLSEDLIQQVAALAAAACNPIDDVRAGASYRKAMVKVFVARALRYIRDNKTPSPSADPHVFLRVPAMVKVANENTRADDTLKLEVNNKAVEIKDANGKVLMDALRQAGFKGCKEGCFEGECGACTVLLNGKAVNSCLVPAMSAAGCHVQTVEGLANEELHPLQQSFVEQGGVQCGFCTPGLLMSGSALLAEKPHGVSEYEVRSALVGNLCRCTGYSKVLAAVSQAG